MSFFLALISKDEAGADSIIAGGLLALIVLCGVTVYMAIVDHSSWNPATYAAAVVLIIGALAGGKTVRDRLSSPP